MTKQGDNPRKTFVRRRLRSLEEAALNMGMSKIDAEYYAGAALKVEIDSAFPLNTLDLAQIHRDRGGS
jgi:hypothetical protein